MNSYQLNNLVCGWQQAMPSARIIQLLSSVFSHMLAENHRLIWLKNAGDEVIGFFPTWFVQVQQGGMINQQRTQLGRDGVYASLPQQKTATQADVTDVINAYLLANANLSSANMANAATPQKSSQHTAVAYEHGLMGFVGYDYAAGNIAPNIFSYTAANTPNTQNARTPPYPSLFFGHYDIYLKKHAGQWWLHLPDDVTDIDDFVMVLVKELEIALQQNGTKQKQHLQLQPLQAQWQKADYAQAFYAVQNYLKAGDCYQANLAQQFTADYVGSPVAALAQLDAATDAPYAGYLHLADFQLISCSPELFVAFKNGQHGDIFMTTKPIKGTLPRLADPHANQQQISKLRASAKDQAENLMIVDLLRNDLSAFAKTGSVSVPKLFEVESFAQVHHLVSTVTAMLAPTHSSFDVLMNALPGGSITGAPKVRAIEIIHELEKHPRGAYCGSMGFLNFNGTGSFNILIRTLEFFQGKMSLWAGGGITIASECTAEYQECLDKISGILAVLKKL